MADSENWILNYYQAIKDGSVTVGHWIRLLYERIIQDLENGFAAAKGGN